MAGVHAVRKQPGEPAHDPRAPWRTAAGTRDGEGAALSTALHARRRPARFHFNTARRDAADIAGGLGQRSVRHEGGDPHWAHPTDHTRRAKGWDGPGNLS